MSPCLRLKLAGFVIWYKASIHLTTSKCWQQTWAGECDPVNRWQLPGVRQPNRVKGTKLPQYLLRSFLLYPRRYSSSNVRCIDRFTNISIPARLPSLYCFWARLFKWFWIRNWLFNKKQIDQRDNRCCSSFKIVVFVKIWKKDKGKRSGNTSFRNKRVFL